MTDPAGRHPMLGQAFRFGLLSAMSFVLNLGVTVVMTEAAGLPSFVSVALAMVTTTAANFLVLRFFVFPDAEQRWFKQFVGFATSIAGFRLAEYLAFIALHAGLGWHYLPVYASILVVSLVGKFLLLRNTVFRPERSIPGGPQPAKGLLCAESE